MKRLVLGALFAFIYSLSAQAGGFMVGEMATRATGMGSAFTAVADDASATWYNPAGLAFVEGTNVMVGGDVVFVLGADFTSNTANPLGPGITARSNEDQFIIPHVYFTYTDPESKLSASIGVNAPFGLETNWPTTAPFSALTTFSRLQLINANANVTFKINDNFAIAGGVDYAYALNVDLNNTVLELGADGDGFGYNVAILYKGDQFSAGATYRSQIDVDLSGTALSVGAPLPPGLTGSATTTVTLPDIANFGVAWMPNDEWTLSFDVDWVGWSSIDQLNIVFGAPLNLALPSTQLLFNWDDTVAFRAGAEWKYLPTMRARFGYVYDPTPITDADFTPAIPLNDRQIFSVGYSYDVSENATLDFAYAYVLFEDRNQTAGVGANALKNGTYSADVHIAAASLSYRF
jgi:long-chain fatty acid transport protein